MAVDIFGMVISSLACITFDLSSSTGVQFIQINQIRFGVGNIWLGLETYSEHWIIMQGRRSKIFRPSRWFEFAADSL